MYGENGRIGIAIPAANSTIEPEFWSYAPDGVAFHFARLPSQPEVTESALRQRERRMNDAIRLLLTTRIGVLVLADMVTNFFMPPGWSGRRIAAISQKFGVKCVSAWSALQEALSAMNIHTLALGTPYPDVIHAKAVQFFRTGGFVLCGDATLGISMVADVPRVSGEQLYRLAASVNPGPQRVVVLLATDLPTFAEIASIERELGITVVTSNQALLWSALRAAGVKAPQADLGRLFLI
jgi:maleate cis-trans isomerase